MSIKKLTIAMLSLLVTGVAYAEEPKVSVVDKDGNKVFFDRSEIKSINLKPETIEIIDFDGEVSSFSKQAVAAINLFDEASKIETISEDGKSITILASKDEISLLNAELTSKWSLFDASGQIVKSGTCEDNEVRISISDILNGVYIFSVSGQSIKFIK